MKNYILKLKVSLFLVFLLFALSFSFFARTAVAHCPLCVGGAAVGLSVARYFGIDDSITGVWLAALLGALSFWGERPLAKRISSKGFKKVVRPSLYLAIFASTIWSFYAFNDYTTEVFKFYLLNLHAGTIAGLPKVVFGIVAGGVLFYLVDMFDDALIKRNGKVYFPYQRVVVTLGSMLIFSLGLYSVLNFYL